MSLALLRKYLIGPEASFVKLAFCALGTVARIFLRSRDFIKISFLFAPVLVFGLAACSAGPESSETSGNLMIKTVAPSEDGSYAFQVVELRGIRNLENMEGFFAQFMLSPKRKSGKIEGSAPKLHFIKSKNSYLVPSDEFSAELVSLYHSFQKLYDFDKALSIENKNIWPRRVAVGVTAAGDSPTNNAFYDSALDAFIFLRYTDKHLPILVNFGIIAHEHFHSLFHKIVLKDTPLTRLNVGEVESQYKKIGIENSKDAKNSESSMPDKPVHAKAKLITSAIANDKMSAMQLRGTLAYNLTLIKGLNEGLADTWAYLVLGDPDFLRQSIPVVAESRNLKSSASDIFISKASIQRVLRQNQNQELPTDFSEKSMMSYAYTIGTQYSRMLRSFTLAKAEAEGISEKQARLVVAKKILTSLESMRGKITDLAYKTEIDPSIFIVTFAEQFEQMSQQECDSLRLAFHDEFFVEKCENGTVVNP